MAPIAVRSPDRPIAAQPRLRVVASRTRERDTRPDEPTGSMSPTPGASPPDGFARMRERGWRRRSRPRHPAAAGRSWRFPRRKSQGSAAAVPCGVPSVNPSQVWPPSVRPDLRVGGRRIGVGSASRAMRTEACTLTVPPVAASRLRSASRILPSGPTLAQACRVGVAGATVAVTGVAPAGTASEKKRMPLVERLDGHRRRWTA